MMCNLTIGILVPVAFGLGIYAGMQMSISEMHRSDYNRDDIKQLGTTGDTLTHATRERPRLIVHEKWVPYWNDELGVGFVYPPTWELSTSSATMSPPRINLQGDGYKLKILPTGSGLPEGEWTHPRYVVGDKCAETWQAPSSYGEGYEQIISAGGLVFWIWTPDKTTVMSDSLLRTVVFY